jgi:sugar phosphate isomerase/epimerase
MPASPKLSICEFTTLHASFAEDLDAYRAAGASGIGICEMKLNDRAEDAARLHESGLVATHCVPLVGSILPGPMLDGPARPDERIAELVEGIRGFAAFKPVACTCLTGPAGDMAPAEARRVVIDGFRAAAAVAADEQVMLGLEPVNPAYARDWSIVTDVSEAVELVEAVDRPSFGLFVDLWHLWDSPTAPEDLHAHASRIIGVHIGDRREPTRGLWDRVLPGDGIADLPTLLAALDDGGYEGWYDIEIFSDDGVYGHPYPDSLWRLEPRELAARAVRGFTNVWAARKHHR